MISSGQASFTKSLQGNLFTKHRRYIMNINSEMDESFIESSELHGSVLGNEIITMDRRQTEENIHKKTHSESAQHITAENVINHK
jgi:hypothetical protein